MELHPRVASAMNAMKALGLSWEKTKPVLKNLLKVYEHNWDHIESENYRVLADAVLDSLESGDSGFKKTKHHNDDADKRDDVENGSFSGKRAKLRKDACFDKGPCHEPPKNEHRRKASTTVINKPLGYMPLQLKNLMPSTFSP